MNEKNQAINQANLQTNAEANVENEAKTVVNGKVVPLSQAKTMQEQFNMQNNQTGTQAHHDNHSESVQAGQVAQNQQAQLNAQAQQNIKTVNVQSGQSHLEQQDHQTIQNSIDANAKTTAKAKTKKAD